jgi:hypothetical protein
MLAAQTFAGSSAARPRGLMLASRAASHGHATTSGRSVVHIPSTMLHRQARGRAAARRSGRGRLSVLATALPQPVAASPEVVAEPLAAQNITACTQDEGCNESFPHPSPPADFQESQVLAENCSVEQLAQQVGPGVLQQRKKETVGSRCWFRHGEPLGDAKPPASASARAATTTRESTARAPPPQVHELKQIVQQQQDILYAQRNQIDSLTNTLQDELLRGFSPAARESRRAAAARLYLVHTPEAQIQSPAVSQWVPAWDSAMLWYAIAPSQACRATPRRPLQPAWTCRPLCCSRSSRSSAPRNLCGSLRRWTARSASCRRLRTARPRTRCRESCTSPTAEFRDSTTRASTPRTGQSQPLLDSADGAQSACCLASRSSAPDGLMLASVP